MQFFNILHPVIKWLLMQKLISTLVVILVLSTHVMSQQWDRHMEVKKMDIRIKSDAFTATTFIEMEFYNPTNTEMEGLYGFELSPGQAITAFQLDLFGRFRDGSIEEKWKATNAYNTIVGKRVDPALLKMDSYNHYSLRIYPVPANGSRKITMTIQQLLVFDKETALYTLPLKITDIIEKLNINIHVTGSSGFPSVIKGLLSEQSFKNNASAYELAWNAAALKADKPLSFSIPLSLQQHALCLKQTGEKTYFALRLKPGIRKEYSIQPQRIIVFWDASASGGKRNIPKEISFLKQYAAVNKVAQLTIITFNQKVQDTAVFYTANNFNSRWTEYLQSVQYEGATQFGVLDFSTVSADAVLLFSDGKNSFGKDIPVPGQTHVYCINSATYPNTPHIEKIIGLTGGRYINLIALSTDEAVETANKAENILLSISAGTTKLDIDQNMHDLKKDALLLTGTIPAGEQTITLSYGNNGNISEVETIRANSDNICDGSAIDRIGMLSVFDSYAQSYGYWGDVLSFGKQEKVITQSTAFIVLEKIEDYIKFNITPPKELESQCDMNIFVKADEERRKQYKKLSEFDILSIVAQGYNERISSWDKTLPMISLTQDRADDIPGTGKKDEESTKTKTTGGSISEPVAMLPGNDKAIMGTEVVVTALGQMRQPKELGYSVSMVRAAELTQGRSVNLQNGLTGKVSGLNIQTLNNGVFADTRITLRGIRSLTGNNQPMLVVDGLPVDIRFINSLNPNDVRDITVLKSAGATAIYGPDGVNGALIIQTKKGSRGGTYSYYWTSYKLKDREDMDYLLDLKAAGYNDKISTYKDLKKIYGDGAGFYFDAAQHLFEVGYKKEALAVLYSAAEITGGDGQVLKAIGYTLENWKRFDEAIRIYKELLVTDKKDLSVYRDLALAYYQNGNYQQAVTTFYEGITCDQEHYEYSKKEIKAMMLQEMNAIIAVHLDELDLSMINKQLIKPLTADLRITVDCNTRSLYNAMSVVEPDGKTCSYNISNPVSSGRLTRSNYYYYTQDSPEEYQVRKAKEGKYKLSLSYSDYGSYGNALKIPTIIKITTFKNFGKANQTLQVENVTMDNQYGQVEIGEVKW